MCIVIYSAMDKQVSSRCSMAYVSRISLTLCNNFRGFLRRRVCQGLLLSKLQNDPVAHNKHCTFGIIIDLLSVLCELKVVVFLHLNLW